MAFSEALKLEVKRKAYFQCCLCKSHGVEVHHIVPQAQNGTDLIDNAAPLCPSCHETYGANPDKRKFIKESRDFWYEVCARRFTSDPDMLAAFSDRLERAATKDDLNQAVASLTDMLRGIANDSRPFSDRKAEFANMSSTATGSISFGRHCNHCGTSIGMLVGDKGRCPNCGTPW